MTSSDTMKYSSCTTPAPPHLPLGLCLQDDIHRATAKSEVWTLDYWTRKSRKLWQRKNHTSSTRNPDPLTKRPLTASFLIPQPIVSSTHLEVFLRLLGHASSLQYGRTSVVTQWDEYMGISHIKFIQTPVRVAKHTVWDIKSSLTSSICRTSVSVAFSEMLPTNTVVATFVSAKDSVGTCIGEIKSVGTNNRKYVKTLTLAASWSTTLVSGGAAIVCPDIWRCWRPMGGWSWKRTGGTKDRTEWSICLCRCTYQNL